MVQFFDPDLDMFIILKNVDDLPKEKIKLKVVAQALSWWSWAPDASWSAKGYATTPYHSLLVKQGSHIHHAAALDKVKDAAKWLGFNPDQAYKIVAISNSTLLTNFDKYPTRCKESIAQVLGCSRRVIGPAWARVSSEKCSWTGF